MTTIDLDGVNLVHQFNCQRCGYSEDFTDDQIADQDGMAYDWRQFGFSTLGQPFKPGALCSNCTRELVSWWTEGEAAQEKKWEYLRNQHIDATRLHDHVGEDNLDETTIPMNREEILQ